MHVHSGVVASDHAMGVGLREGRPFAFTESERTRLTRYASLQPDGTIVLDLKGLAPRGEEDSEEVCHILLQALLKDEGREITLLGSGDRDDDFLIEEKGNRYGVQVVRAMTDRRFWQSLAHDKAIVRVSLTPERATEALKRAIEHKAVGRDAIPLAQRRNLVLALDAFRVPALALGVVTEEFRSEWGDWGKELGFLAIYVVGPDVTFVARLDAAPTSR
jgi:hypothetical protein